MYSARLTFLSLAMLFVSNVRAQTSFAPLIEELMPSVVNISSDVEKTKDAPNVSDNLIFEENTRENLGSGFVVDSKGYIATNLHVIEKASKISVISADGEVYDAILVGQDEKTDIALIKINPVRNLQAVVFGNSDNVKVGDWVLAIGNPFGLGSSVTAGIISAKQRDISDNSYNDYLQTDASINQGNSGGPMFNIDGEVIGINTAIFSNSGNSVGVGFALPSNVAKQVIEQLRTTGTVQRAWLGVELKKAVAKDKVSGLAITALLDEELANSNNLQIGDMILKINSIPITSLKDFYANMFLFAPKTEILLTLWRNSEIITQKVIVDIMPKNSKTVKNTESKKGKYYTQIGAYVDDFTITALDDTSEMAAKGVSVGDKIVKINDKNVSNMEDFDIIVSNANINRLPLYFELKDLEGVIYFVEINFNDKV